MQTRLSAFFQRYNGTLLALPGLLWLVVFFLVPLFLIVVVSFMSRSLGSVGTPPLTLTSYERSFTLFGTILVRSIRIAFATTIICLLVGYPVAFFIRQRKRIITQKIMLFLIMLPFWTNFLVRTYAWQSLLSREGLVNGALLRVGVIAEPIQILNTEFALLVGLTYAYLPYMILPIYAGLSRFDFHLVEAAQDLGAKDWQTFWRVLFPITLPSVVIGSVLVFIPTIGDFVVADLMGGNQGIMIGNLIQVQYQGIGNLPLGAALSVILMLPIVLALAIYARFSGKET